MADAGEIYAHAGEQLGSHIAEAITRWQTIRRHDEDVHQKAQGLLDAASGIMVADGKGGQKPFFSKDQIATATNLLHMHKEAQAQAFMQANGFMQAARRAAMMNNAQLGPQTGYAKDGTPMRLSASGAWEPYVPRTRQGLTAGSVQSNTRLTQAARARTAEKQQQTFDGTLKSLGIDNRETLFNPAYIQRGYLNPTEIPSKQAHWYSSKTPGKPAGTFVPLKPDEQPPEGVTPGYRVGFKPPVYPTKSDGVTQDTSAPASIKGSQGKFLPEPDLQGYRDMAIGLADPKFKNALAAPEWAKGKDPEAPTDPSNPDSKTVGAVLQDATNYANSMRKQALVNPDYRARVLGAAVSGATDTITQVPGAPDPGAVAQPAAPVQTEEETSGDEGE